MKLQLGANGRYETEIDDEDYAFISQWRWQYKTSERRHKLKVYAKRTTWAKGRKVTLLLSHVILTERKGGPRPSLQHVADHKDGNSLNDRKGNLRWLTDAENKRHRQPQTRE